MPDGALNMRDRNFVKDSATSPFSTACAGRLAELSLDEHGAKDILLWSDAATQLSAAGTGWIFRIESSRVISPPG
jgi:hypothetical protein